MGRQNCSSIRNMKVLLLLALVVLASSSATSFKVQTGEPIKGACNLCKDGIKLLAKFTKGFDKKEKAKVKAECSKVPIVGLLCETYADKMIDTIEKADPTATCKKSAATLKNPSRTFSALNVKSALTVITS